MILIRIWWILELPLRLSRVSTQLLYDAMLPVNEFSMYFADIHSREQLNAFLAESLIMKDFHHPHILGLLGVCFDAPDGSPYIVLPFMANGSVKTYLKEKRTHVLDVNSYPKV